MDLGKMRSLEYCLDLPYHLFPIPFTAVIFSAESLCTFALDTLFSLIGDARSTVLPNPLSILS